MLRKFNKDTLENKAAWWNPEVPEGPGKEPKNTIAVLVAGDSLTYSSVSTLGLWNQYGITSYVCGQPGQMLSETYKQRVGLAQAILGFPEIIILDVKYSIVLIVYV